MEIKTPGGGGIEAAACCQGDTSCRADRCFLMKQLIKLGLHQAGQQKPRRHEAISPAGQKTEGGVGRKRRRKDVGQELETMLRVLTSCAHYLDAFMEARHELAFYCN